MKLQRNSFVERSARERVRDLLDKGTFRELLGPFDGFESPHLPAQSIVPQSDDGVVVGKGLLDGTAAVVIATEGAFQGGGIGEVSGAKIAGALELALRDNRNGVTTRPVVVFDTGGVRLQEANYGLLAIAEIQSAVSALREFVPVIGVIPGKIGCFGGMSITAGLFSTLIVTKQARLTLNGPEVIEQEAGIEELDAKDKGRVFATIGGTQRFETGFADVLVEDDLAAVIDAVQTAFYPSMKVPRCKRTEHYFQRVHAIDLSQTADPQTARDLYQVQTAAVSDNRFVDEQKSYPLPSRGRTWFEKLAGSAQNLCVNPSTVLCDDVNLQSKPVRIISIVPDANNRFARARLGEAGLEEGWAIARCIRGAIEADSGKSPRAILALVDVPSQAYGYREELFGLHQALAASVDAYAAARRAGHPVVTLIVGNAISGGFLAHGLQGSRIVAFDDPGVAVHAMSTKSAARITKRSVSELKSAAAKVPGIAYDIRSFDSLGAVDVLMQGVDADNPGQADVERVINVLADEIERAKTDGADLCVRLASTKAEAGRRMSIKVREELQKQWTI